MSDEARPSRKLWILAAVAALALHLGGAALALAHLRTDDDDDGLGASGAEFAVEMASPKAPETDLPPGPDSEAMQEQQALPEQKAETKETELPKDQSQPVDDPDRVVTENISKKPQDEDPKIAAVETPLPRLRRSRLQRRGRHSTRTRARPRRPWRRCLASAKTSSGSRPTGIARSARTQAHKVNPEGKQPNNQKVKVSFAINRRGNVLSVDVVESSGDVAYDAAALSIVRKSDPIPQPPAGLTEDRFERTVDIIFTPPDEKKKKKSAQRQ